LVFSRQQWQICSEQSANEAHLIHSIGVLCPWLCVATLWIKSKAYADAAIPAIITTWLDKALLDRVRREFNQQRNLLCP
jgi:hypothetical protein